MNRGRLERCFVLFGTCLGQSRCADKAEGGFGHSGGTSSGNVYFALAPLGDYQGFTFASITLLKGSALIYEVCMRFG